MADEQPVGAFNTTPNVAPEPSKPPPVVPETDAIEKIRDFFETKFGLNSSTATDEDDDGAGDGAKAADRTPKKVKEPTKRNRVLSTVDMEGLVQHWKAGGFKRIVTMVGAGISTSAGIPDFRSPTTGLYNNLKKYKLPYPTAIFEIDYFLHKPQPFFALAKELYPGQFRPTPCHYFIRLLHDKSLLHRHYTQNIDTLDRIAGIPDEKLVEAHGTFHTAHCVKCRTEHTQAWMKEQIFGDQLPRCRRCKALVKPDIVFFGENLPEKFYLLPEKDFGQCDLLIVMGTSLEVHPFAGLVDMVGDRCVRLLINREAVGHGRSKREGFQFEREHNDRDVLWEGDCDEGIWWLAGELGFKEELEELIRVETERFDAEQQVDEGKGKEKKLETKVE